MSGTKYDPFSNVIDVYVQRLRRKLDNAGEPSLIATRRGEGYASAEFIENSCWRPYAAGC
jgi:DNA-binding response OmpR family regulator